MSGGEANEPSSGSSTRTLVILGVFLLAFSTLSDAALSSSAGFWRAAMRLAEDERSSPLYVDAQLHTWAAGEKKVVVVGSSIVATDINEAELAAKLGLADGEVAKLWMPDGSAVELSMLAPAIARVAPDVVVYLVSIWNFFDTDDVGELRFYDPRVAASLFRPNEILSDIGSHASGLLAWHHLVIRHREYLRRTFIRGPLESLSDSRAQRRRLQVLRRMAVRERILQRRDPRLTAGPEDFDCSGIRTRALSVMGERLERDGVEFVMLRTPTRGRWDYDPVVSARIDACMDELSERKGLGYVPVTAVPEFFPDDFRDPLHMTPDGKVKFTDALPGVISPWLGGGQGGS